MRSNLHKLMLLSEVVINCSFQKNCGAGGGSFCDKEFQVEAGEESVRSKLAGHSERVEGERLMTRDPAFKMNGRRKRREQRRRWEYCVKRNLVGLGRELELRTSHRVIKWRRAVQIVKRVH